MSIIQLEDVAHDLLAFLETIQPPHTAKFDKRTFWMKKGTNTLKVNRDMQELIDGDSQSVLDFGYKKNSHPTLRNIGTARSIRMALARLRRESGELDAMTAEAKATSQQITHPAANNKNGYSNKNRSRNIKRIRAVRDDIGEDRTERKYTKLTVLLDKNREPNALEDSKTTSSPVSMTRLKTGGLSGKSTTLKALLLAMGNHDKDERSMSDEETIVNSEDEYIPTDPKWSSGIYDEDDV